MIAKVTGFAYVRDISAVLAQRNSNVRELS